MKIRNGFVSNSSSSSFVIGFDKQPTSALDVFQALFPGKDLDHRVGDYSECRFSGVDVATMLWDDIKDQIKPPSVQDIAAEFSPYCNTNTEICTTPPQMEYPQDNAWKYQHSDPEKFKRLQKEYDLMCQKYHEDLDAWVQSNAEAVYREMKDMSVYVFSFSDHGGDFECYMEHGNYLENIKYFRFSHH
jgi:hypothetical protein